MDGRTKVYGIIANPVEHSMSPVLHNLYGEQTGVDLVYVPFKVKEEALQKAVEGAFALNVQGMSVTVPHKQAVMPYLAEIDTAAADIGAVNTLVRTDSGYKGYNTDVPGLLRAVREEGVIMQGRKCIVLGAGGAARAASYMLAKEGAEEIWILNRSLDKAQALAGWLNRLTGKDTAKPLALSDYASIPGNGYFAIQSTSVGMHPKTEYAPIEAPAFYEKISEAYDCIYTPAETKFMKYVSAAGGRAFNGLNMLLYQGVAAFELWNPGVRVEAAAIKAARRRIQELLEKGKA